MLMSGRGNVPQMERFRMMPVLILLAIFSVGFGAGYTARAMRSRKRKELRRLYAPYGPTTDRHGGSFAKARRAF